MRRKDNKTSKTLQALPVPIVSYTLRSLAFVVIKRTIIGKIQNLSVSSTPAIASER